jgi:hypothetical protein
MLLTLSQFKGMAPRVTPLALPIQAAQTAANCLFGSGALRPVSATAGVTLHANDSIVLGTPLSIFKLDGDRWLSWISDANVCRSPLPSDSAGAGFSRIYWTGDILPKMGDFALITSQVGRKPSASWPLGISKPAVAVTPTVSGVLGDELLQITRTYVYTFVSKFGEEGPPSTPSVTCTLYPGNSVTVSGMSVGNGNIVAKRVYRVSTGSAASEYQYVGEVDNATASFVDTILDEDLSEILPSSNWVAPSPNMVGLISHPGGFLVGFYDNNLCFSEPYMPHAWPATYEIPLDADIVAVGAFGNSILVTTTGLPYIVTGSVPGQMGTPEKFEKGEPCILKRGFVDMGYACIYPGPSGLWLAGTGAVELATASLMTKKEWSAYSATLQFAVQYETLYIGFMTTGGFIFDTATGDFSTHDITATAGYYDREAGKLYLVVAGAIVEWDAGVTPRSLVWKSKKFQTPSPTNFGAAQMFASGPVTMKFYADGVLKHTQAQTVVGSDPFRLPSGFRATNWEIQIEGAYEVTSLLMASTVSELTQV